MPRLVDKVVHLLGNLLTRLAFVQLLVLQHGRIVFLETVALGHIFEMLEQPVARTHLLGVEVPRTRHGLCVNHVGPPGLALCCIALLVLLLVAACLLLGTAAATGLGKRLFEFFQRGYGCIDLLLAVRASGSLVRLLHRPHHVSLRLDLLLQLHLIHDGLLGGSLRRWRRCQSQLLQRLRQRLRRIRRHRCQHLIHGCLHLGLQLVLLQVLLRILQLLRGVLAGLFNGRRWSRRAARRARRRRAVSREDFCLLALQRRARERPNRLLRQPGCQSRLDSGRAGSGSAAGAARRVCAALRCVQSMSGK